MANLKEDSTWEQGIYQFETSDPVMGGPNGIDNVPTSQLANRTLWLKNQLAAAVQSIDANKSAADAAFALKATTLTAGSGLTGGGTLGGNRVLSMGKPSKITATSTDEVVSDTHSHSIDKASTSVAGIVMLVNALNSTATDRALTAAQGKALADMIGALGDEAFKQRGTLGSRNLDTLKGITNFGVWFMNANSGATTALNYHADRAGALLVLPGAYEGIQLYILWEMAQIYIRNTTQSGAWSDWRIIGDATKQQMAAAMQHQASTNGYTKLPNDLIDQWGEVLMSWQGEGPVKVTFPIAFPNECYNVQITAKSSGRSGFVGTDLTIGVGEITATGFSAMLNTWTQGVAVNDFQGFLWRAIGK